MESPSSVTPSIVGEQTGAVLQEQFDFAAVPAPAPISASAPAPTSDSAPVSGPAPLPDELPPAKGLAEEVQPAEEAETRQSFGQWLISQNGRKGWIGELAKAAKGDRDFPKRGSPDDVRKRLQQMGGDADAFEALDDAELDWASV